MVHTLCSECHEYLDSNTGLCGCDEDDDEDED